MQSLLDSLLAAALHASGHVQSPCALAKQRPDPFVRSCAALCRALLSTDSSAVLQLGTHLRAKRKREEMSVLLRKTKK